MKTEDFTTALAKYEKVLGEIERGAAKLHFEVRQTYGKNLPYSIHLCDVASLVKHFAAPIVRDENDIVPLLFGAYYHDSIEDARVTYYDVLGIAKKYMNDEQALVAAEIVYALTTEKGKTKQERTNDKYFMGIRTTPYAPLVKACDRLANMKYSAAHAKNEKKSAGMFSIYKKELPEFLSKITTKRATEELSVPKELLDALEQFLVEK